MDRLDAVAVFVAVAESAGFALAARRLGRPPAAVSRAIAELEENLAVQLFNRTTRSVALTEDGTRFLIRARALLAAHSEFEGGSLEDAEPTGKIRVTAPINFGRRHLMPLVNAFLAKFPKVDAQIVLSDRIVSLVEEGFDLAVRVGQPRDPSLKYTQVGSVALGIYASPGYLEEHGVPLTPSDLLAHNAISCGTFNPVPEKWPISGRDGTGYVMVKPRLVMSSTEAAASTAAAGLGITSLLSDQAAPFVERGELVQIMSEYAITGLPINIAQPGTNYVAPKVHAFVAEIGEGLKKKFSY